MKIKSFIVASATVFASCAATAATTTYNVDHFTAGSAPTVAGFATLLVSTKDNQTFSFTLSTQGSFADFGTKAFIGSLAVDADPDVGPGVRKLPSIVNGSVSGGVASVGVSGGNGPSGAYEFRYNFGIGKDKLMAGEAISWSSTFVKGGTSFEGMALHVQGLGAGDSQWYALSAAPVPEPESYAMFLAGLGLLGAISRRRKA